MRLIEKVWFQGHFAKWLVVPLLLPLTVLFWLITELRRVAYRYGIKASIKVDLPVLVVGNIGVGGNGKTPVTLYLLSLCQQLGFKAGVISRGYGGNAPFYPYLIDDQTSADYSGDEPLMIYHRTGAPVVVGSDRIKSAALLKQLGCQLIIADDGLQHYRLNRDSEIIVVDNKRGFGNGLLMPAGPLRELSARLSNANFIVLNGSGNSGDKVSTLVAKKHILQMHLMPTRFINLCTGTSLDVDEFNKRYSTVNALAAIGDPERFFNTLAACKITANIKQPFVDHHQFTVQDFARFPDEIPLVMTEKDAVKCADFAQDNWWYLAVSASFDTQQQQQLIDELTRLASLVPLQSVS